MGNVRLRAGDLDRRINIHAVTQVKDAGGEPTDALSVIALDVPAQRLENRRQQKFTAGSDQEAADLKFRIRWRHGIKSQQVVTHGSECFEVTAVMEFGRRVGLDLMCKRLGDSV